MIKVSKNEFYRIVSRMDVHPHSEREYTRWENIRTREMIGRSTHGWMTPTGAKEEEFYLSDNLAAAPQEVK